MVVGAEYIMCAWCKRYAIEFYGTVLKNTYSTICTITGEGVTLVTSNDILHSEPCMEMSSEKTRESISTTFTIDECMHLGRSEKKKRKGHRGTSSTSDENPTVILRWGVRDRRGFSR